MPLPTAIYLDHHATTPCDPRVLAAMRPYYEESFANPSSPYEAGDLAMQAVERARGQVAALLNGSAHEIVWTSGATESNNLAILGAARRHAKLGGKKRRLVTTAIEHPAVLEPMQHLAREGWDVVILPVDRVGRADLDAAERAINADTLLVSVQGANHEIGTIEPVREVARFAHRHGALIHCDAAQACGKIPVDVESWDVDLLSLSGHKLYGPKGVGALWLRGGPRALPLEPLFFGGAQENALRPGTHNVPAIVGLGAACEIAQSEMPAESARLAQLRDRMEARLLGAISDLTINGDSNHRLPHNSNLGFPCIEAEALLANLPGLALSVGSACNSGALEPSPILLSLGLSREQADGSVRFGLGRFNTEAEIETAIEQIITAFERLSRMASAK